MMPERAMLDTVRRVATPELVELGIHCAGPVPRATAYLLDALIRFGALMGVGLAAGFLGKAGPALLGLLWFFLEWLYPVVFEVLWHGATPGKRALGLVVLNRDGSPVAWGPSMTRNLLRAADFLPLLYFFGLLSTLLDRDFRRLGDIVAGTVVAHRTPPAQLPSLPDVPAWAPAKAASREAQQAVLAFAERATGLSPARQEELAELVPELTGGAEGERGVRRLIGFALRLNGKA